MGTLGFGVLRLRDFKLCAMVTFWLGVEALGPLCFFDISSELRRHSTDETSSLLGFSLGSAKRFLNSLNGSTWVQEPVLKRL